MLNHFTAGQVHITYNVYNFALPKKSRRIAPEETSCTNKIRKLPEPFTLADAQYIPPIDRMGKKGAWSAMQDLLTQKVELPLDVTDGRLFNWRCWICNLSGLTVTLIGLGVVHFLSKSLPIDTPPYPQMHWSRHVLIFSVC